MTQAFCWTTAFEHRRHLRERLTLRSKLWDKTRHPRGGNDKNKGQFSKGAGGAATREKDEPEEETPYQKSQEWLDFQRFGKVEQDRCEPLRGTRSGMTTWNYVDDGVAYEQTVYLEEGEYQVVDGEPASAVPVWRWVSAQDYSGDTDHGEWLAVQDDAEEEGLDFARENDQEVPEEEEEDDEEDSDQEADEEAWGELAYASSVSQDDFPPLEQFDELVGDAGLTAGLKGCKARVAGEGKEVSVELTHPKLEDCRRTLGVDDDGNLFCHNDIFVLRDEYQGEGIGADLFANQVQQCARAGVSYIETHAARGPQFNGYYTWPRFGYDQSLDSVAEDFPKTVARAREAFPDAKSVLDVMITKEGRDWWKANGCNLLHAKFDLSEGSRSRRVLDAYLRERGGG